MTIKTWVVPNANTGMFEVLFEHPENGKTFMVCTTLRKETASLMSGLVAICENPEKFWDRGAKDDS